jgi:hypothetical protein
VDLIAGDDKPGKVEGVVKIGGRNASSCFKKIGSYVRQQDVFSVCIHWVYFRLILTS